MSAILRLLYIPFNIIAGQISKRLGKKSFDAVWAKIDDERPPVPGSGQSTAVKTIGAMALRAGVMAGAAAAVDRAFAHTFHYVVGIWPRKPPKPADD